jgi:hypothetical protein
MSVSTLAGTQSRWRAQALASGPLYTSRLAAARLLDGAQDQPCHGVRLRHHGRVPAVVPGRATNGTCSQSCGRCEGSGRMHYGTTVSRENWRTRSCNRPQDLVGAIKHRDHLYRECQEGVNKDTSGLDRSTRSSASWARSSRSRREWARTYGSLPPRHWQRVHRRPQTSNIR